MAYIEFDHVVKEYPSGSSVIRALDEASFTAEQGELSVILGQSGAGKTTALNIRGRHGYRHNRPRSGRRTRYYGSAEKGTGDLPAQRYRFVFQFYNLVPNLTALENVELASQICPDHFDPGETLRKVGLGERMDNFPAQLSGGEQQRVSIARAIAKKPKLLLCDEPTGALDYETGKEVLQLLQDICQTQGMTVMIITHNSALAPMAHKVIRFRSGKVTSEEINATPQPIADIEW